eukprot:gene9804-2129_t
MLNNVQTARIQQQEDFVQKIKTDTAAKIGDNCEIDTDCYLSKGTEQSITCIKNKCSKRRYNGESCDFNEQCFGGNCAQNICRGKDVGEICDPRQLIECDEGLFCSKKTNACIPRIDENEDCHDHVDSNIRNPRMLPEGSNFMIMCKGGFMCMGTTKKRECRPYRGGGIGTYCDYSLNGHYECEFGLRCDRSAKKCVEHSGSKFPCLGDRNCLSNEACVCKGNSTGKCTAISGSNTDCGFHDTAQEWVKCSKEHNCALDSKNTFHTWLVDIFSPNTCMGKFCRNVPRNTLCCSLKNQELNIYSEYELKEIQKYCGDVGSDVLSVLMLLTLFGLIVGSIAVTMIIITTAILLHQKKN